MLQNELMVKGAGVAHPRVAHATLIFITTSVPGRVRFQPPSKDSGLPTFLHYLDNTNNFVAQ